MKKYIVILLIIALFFGIYKYIFRAPEDISKATANFTLPAIELVEEFSNDLATSEKKYANKVLVVEGIVTEIENDEITLSEGVFCKLTTANTSIKKGAKIKIKGLYIGFDDLFELVKMNQCSIVE